MDISSTESRIALLVDADNITTKYVGAIFDESNKYGDIVIRRVYGDWTKPTIAKWKDACQKYAMKPIMQEDNISGKNASDICLVIDAMKLLYEKKADVFCIVSSDSDFTLLAKEIRENGIAVIGMGEEKTPQAFVNACKKFVILDKLIEEDNLDISEAETLEDNKTVSDKKSSVTSRERIEKTIIEIIEENDSKNKSTGLGEVGSRLSKKYPEFDVRNYGYSNLSTFVRSLENIKVSGIGNNQRNVVVDIASKDKINLEKMVIDIIQKYGGSINTGRLCQELKDKVPNIQSHIKATGVTKISTYLKSINSVKFTNNNNEIKIV